MSLYRDFNGNSVQKRIMDKYHLIIPKKYTQFEIIRYLNRILPYRVSFFSGMEGEYTVKVESTPKPTFLGICHRLEDGIYITTISESLDGIELEYGRESFEFETLIYNICEEIKGLVWIERYEIIDHCKKANTKYCINYDKDTLDYKLMNFFVNKLDKPLEIVKMVTILKEDKDNVLKCFEEGVSKG